MLWIDYAQCQKSGVFEDYRLCCLVLDVEGNMVWSASANFVQSIGAEFRLPTHCLSRLWVVKGREDPSLSFDEVDEKRWWWWKQYGSL